MMEFEPPQKENKAMGPGQIHRAITSMPMAPYWEGLIANSKHVTFPVDVLIKTAKTSSEFFFLE